MIRWIESPALRSSCSTARTKGVARPHAGFFQYKDDRKWLLGLQKVPSHGVDDVHADEQEERPLEFARAQTLHRQT